MIRFACPKCGIAYQVEATQAGQPAKCDRCQEAFRIPESESPAPPPQAPATALALPTTSSLVVEIKPCPVCGTKAQADQNDLGVEVECPACLSKYEAVAVNPLPSSKRDQPVKAKKSRRRWDDEEREGDRDDDDDDRPRRRKKRRRPSQITIIAGMMLGGGIWGLIFALAMAINTFCLWPGVWFAVVWSIFALIRGINMLNEQDQSAEPRTLASMQILMLLNCDMVNCIMGIITLVLLNDEQVQAHYERLDQNR